MKHLCNSCQNFSCHVRCSEKEGIIEKCDLYIPKHEVNKGQGKLDDHEQTNLEKLIREGK